MPLHSSRVSNCLWKDSYLIGTGGLCRLRTSVFGSRREDVLEPSKLKAICSEIASYQSPAGSTFPEVEVCPRLADRIARLSVWISCYRAGRAFFLQGAQSEFREQLWYTLTGGNFPPVLLVLADVRNPWRFKKSA